MGFDMLSLTCQLSLRNTKAALCEGHSQVGNLKGSLFTTQRLLLAQNHHFNSSISDYQCHNRYQLEGHPTVDNYSHCYGKHVCSAGMSSNVIS